jgi:hypothetical protein
VIVVDALVLTCVLVFGDERGRRARAGPASALTLVTADLRRASTATATCRVEAVS